jgi:hypothetical protein
MRIASDIASLQSAKLPPNAVNSIGSIVDTRPVILAKANFSTYTGPGTTLQTVMSYLVPGGALHPGDCFRLNIGGSANNASGTNQPLGAVIVLTQGSTTAEFGYRNGTYPPTGALYIAWRSEILICTSIPGATGQYLAGGGPRGTLSYSTNPSNNKKLPSAGLGFAAYGNTLITDTTLAGAPTGGGTLVATAGVPVGGGMFANSVQQAFSGSQPILLEVKVGNLTAANTIVIVNSGVLEGL